MPCTTILVGKKASNNGSTFISRNDDGSWNAKRVIKVSKEDQKERKYKSIIANLEIELPENPLAYTSSPNVNLKRGLWPANGINEENVAMTATETITSNPRVLAADPYVVYSKEEKKVEDKVEVIEHAGGIGEEDLVAIILPYIHSAKEGVVRTGELLAKYGTYEANGMAFSDENEIWWLETIGGHHFIAARVPDEKVVIMPNQFGLDNFDFDDAYGKQENYMCSPDLKEFVINNNLDLVINGKFNPRLAFGSRRDQDHIYNTPRAWFMGKYFMPRQYKWEGCNADFTPESDDIPWSFVPDHKVTIEDIKYVLSSHYQGTQYDPYGHKDDKGKYRSIGVPNSDVSVILEIRNNVAKELKGIEWMSMGGSGFTGCIPLYTSVNKMPKYISETTEKVDTDYFYWQSRLIAVITDAQYAINIIHDERFQQTTLTKGHQIMFEYDEKFNKEGKIELLEEANEKICAMLKEESDKTLGIILENASNKMKTRYNRNDN